MVSDLPALHGRGYGWEELYQGPAPAVQVYWDTSRDSKSGLRWHKHENPDVPLVHPNTKPLARALHEFWVDRYTAQLRGGLGAKPAEDDQFRRDLGLETPNPTENPPYEEPEDEKLFRELLLVHSRNIPSSKVTEGVVDVVEMSRAYLSHDWSA